MEREDRDAIALVATAGATVVARRWRRRIAARRAVRDRVVLITGGSRGLGFTIAREVVSLVGRVAICGRDPRSLERARRELGDVVALRCDVGDRDQVEAMIAQVERRLGPIDVLVNNAGIITVGPIASQTRRDFEEAMDVMFWGMVDPVLAVLPSMRRRRTGRIVNVTSIGGKLSFPHLLPYNSAKFAAVGFSEGLRAEVARDGISVTTVVPGLMRTGSHLNAFFAGRSSAEFGWFGAGASTPFVAMRARRAARKIVEAAATGRAEIILTPQAKIAARLAGLFPGVTSRALGVVNRLLPGANGALGRRTGREARTAVSSVLTLGGERPARRFGQYVPDQPNGEE